jgi:hypothetical protein
VEHHDKPSLYSGALSLSLLLPITTSLRPNDLRHEEHFANPFRKLAHFDGARTYVKYGVTDSIFCRSDVPSDWAANVAFMAKSVCPTDVFVV